MVSAVNLNHTNPTVAGNNATNAGSETGDFDFLSYLLGLQATQSEESASGIELGMATSRLKTADNAEESDNPKGDKLSQWNQIFPGVSTLSFTQNGYGPSLDLRITKTEGISVTVVPASA